MERNEQENMLFKRFRDKAHKEVRGKNRIKRKKRQWSLLLKKKKKRRRKKRMGRANKQRKINARIGWKKGGNEVCIHKQIRERQKIKRGVSTTKEIKKTETKG